MAQFVYIDETGSTGKGAAKQPYLTLVAVIVDEDKVRPLAEAMSDLAMKHLGWEPADFEFHGHEIWGPSGYWKGKKPSELLAAYEDLIDLLPRFDLGVSHASIHKARLHKRYGGSADDNAYLLALQFLLEKIDRLSSQYKVVVADEAKEHQLRAVAMVADAQKWGGGEVPGTKLKTVIDSLHFVRSNASPGVQMADTVAYLLQRNRRGPEPHPDSQAARARMMEVIDACISTYRMPWPAA